jgi:hypothetical protein
MSGTQCGERGGAPGDDELLTAFEQSADRRDQAEQCEAPRTPERETQVADRVDGL